MMRDGNESKVLIFCISLILLVCAYSFNKYDNIIGTNEKLRIGSFKSHSDWLANSITDQFFERYGDTEVIAHSLSLQGQNATNIQKTLNTYVRLYQVYDVILFVDLDGRYISSNNQDIAGNHLDLSRLKNKSFVNEEWFQQAIKKDKPKVHVSNIQFDPISTFFYGTPKEGTSFTTLVTDNKTGKPIGVLSARANLSWIQNSFLAIFKSLAGNNFSELELILVDKNGVELIHYDPVIQAKSQFHPAGFNLVSGVNLAAAGFFPAQRLSLGESGAVVARGAHSNENQVVGYTRIQSPKFDPDLGWGVLVSAPSKEVLAYAYSARIGLRTIGIILAILLVLAGIALSQYLSVRLALMKHSERVRSILDHVADGIITINEQAQIETWNLASENIFGYTSKEVLGQNVNILMPEPFHSQHDSYMANYLTSGHGKIIGIGREVIGRRKDGTLFPMDLAVSEFKIGEQRYFTAVTRDITGRKKTAEDLRTAKEAAEAANRTKSAFLANMSHEIRTPLGAILGFSELLVNQETNPSEKETFVAAIKRNGELLSNIIDDILDLSRVEAGKLKIEIRQTCIHEVLSEVISLLQPRAIKNGTILTGVCDENIPSIVMSDPLRLKQILINIVGNAIKFTEKGFVDVHVKALSSEATSLHLAFVVKDSGVGVSKEQVENLFQPFSQVDVSTKRKFGGAGLGLALSRRLANLLGGDILLSESSPGKGSTFTVTITAQPISRKQQTTFQERAEHILPSPTKDHKLTGIKVLLVEDSVDNQILITKLLRLAGATVSTAENGVQALEMAQHHQYDIVLMDIQMPVMDGLEAATTLRKLGYQKPIIALTAHALKEERQQCLNSGFDDHISKPIDFSTFIKKVAQYGKYQADRKLDI